jgi:hypothetical protein
MGDTRPGSTAVAGGHGDSGLPIGRSHSGSTAARIAFGHGRQAGPYRQAFDARLNPARARPDLRRRVACQSAVARTDLALRS